MSKTSNKRLASNSFSTHRSHRLNGSSSNVMGKQGAVKHVTNNSKHKKVSGCQRGAVSVKHRKPKQKVEPPKPDIPSPDDQNIPESSYASYFHITHLTDTAKQQREQHLQRRALRQVHSGSPMLLSRRTSWKISEKPDLHSPVRASVLQFSPKALVCFRTLRNPTALRGRKCGRGRRTR